MSFDTLATARAPKEAGLEERQAEAIAEAIQAGQGDLATKTDIETFRAEFKADLEKAINRMLLAQIAVAGALLAAIKFLP